MFILQPRCQWFSKDPLSERLMEIREYLEATFTPKYERGLKFKKKRHPLYFYDKKMINSVPNFL